MKRDDIRIRSGFLVIPKTIDGETRWFCWAEWEEEYMIDGLTIKTAEFRGWRPVRWL